MHRCSDDPRTDLPTYLPRQSLAPLFARDSCVRHNMEVFRASKEHARSLLKGGKSACVCEDRTQQLSGAQTPFRVLRT